MKDKLKDLLFLKALLASNKELVEMKNKVRKQFGESTIEEEIAILEKELKEEGK